MLNKSHVSVSVIPTPRQTARFPLLPKWKSILKMNHTRLTTDSSLKRKRSGTGLSLAMAYQHWTSGAGCKQGKGAANGETTTSHTPPPPTIQVRVCHSVQSPALPRAERKKNIVPVGGDQNNLPLQASFSSSGPNESTCLSANAAELIWTCYALERKQTFFKWNQ